MPVRPPITTLYPETLLDDSCSWEADDSVWWVIHTRPRAEKVLADELVRRSTPFFLPLYERHFRHRGQSLVSQLPLFPGYLFLRGDRETLHQVLMIRGIVRSLHVYDQGELHQDLCRLHHLITARLAMTPEERLRPGTQVEIMSGPLQGLQGKVVREGGQSRFVVEVNFLCQGASCLLDGCTLRPLDPTELPSDDPYLDRHGVGAR